MKPPLCPRSTIATSLPSVFGAVFPGVTLANLGLYRYDADDSANHAAPAAAASNAANPPPAAPEPTDQPTAPTITPSIENVNMQVDQFDSGQVQQSLENGSNQEEGDVWDSGQGQGHDTGAMGMKHEAQGTGIKEDG